MKYGTAITQTLVRRDGQNLHFKADLKAGIHKIPLFHLKLNSSTLLIPNQFNIYLYQNKSFVNFSLSKSSKRIEHCFSYALQGFYAQSSLDIFVSLTKRL